MIIFVMEGECVYYAVGIGVFCRVIRFGVNIQVQRVALCILCREKIPYIVTNQMQVTDEALSL